MIMNQTQSVIDSSTKNKKRFSDEEAIERFRELERVKLERQPEIDKYRETHRIEFFKPIEPYQTKILEYVRAGKKTITLQGANQIGKTVLGSVLVGSWCLGIQPWDKEETIFGRRAVRGRVLCSDWEKHAAEVVVPELKIWLPVGQYTTKKNNLGIEYMFNFKNGSSLELLTNKQATTDHEGWKGDFVWADEPPDRDKYVANKRGLIASNGIFLLTMTAVSQSWILDEVVLNVDPSYGSVTEIPIRANPHLTEAGIRSFETSLREDEKVARIRGGWLNLVGLVLKGFKPDVHLIKALNEIPTDWPVVPMIDWHINKPHAIGFYSIDKRGFHYVIEELWRNGSAEEIADEIIRKKQTKAWRITEAFIDPLSKGDTAYIKNMNIDIQDTFTRMREKLYPHGIDLKVASKDKESGIKNIEDMLIGVNGMPTLYFFNTLNRIEKEGHVWEIQRWTYDENQDPKKENDHFMENLYRMTLTGMKWSPMRGNSGELKSEINFSPLEPNYGIRESETEFNVFEG